MVLFKLKESQSELFGGGGFKRRHTHTTYVQLKSHHPLPPAPPACHEFRARGVGESREEFIRNSQSRLQQRICGRPKCDDLFFSFL